MLETYGGAALLLAASAIIGQAVLVLSGRVRWSWLAPAVGLASLVVLSAVTIRLPGRATTATALCAAATLLAIVLVLRRTVIGWPLHPLAVAALPVLGASVPFLANGRVGILGVGLDNDMATHLLWAEGLRSPSMASLYPDPNGYPLGPHSLVATLASTGGLRVDHAFTALALAVVPITAITAAGVLPHISTWRKTLIGTLASLTYLASAYYVQGSFKETMLALFFLAFVLVLRELKDATALGHSSFRDWMVAGLPAGLLVAASLYTYSYPALAWYGGFLALWLAVELLASPENLLNPTSRRRWLMRISAVTLGASAVVVVTILPSIDHILEFLKSMGTSSGEGGIGTSNLGNLLGPISPFETLGVWLTPDYRFTPTNTFHSGELASLALAALIFGLLWALRRRDFSLPAAVGICAAIYLYSRDHQSPYVAAKALVIASPLVMVVSARALFSGREDELAARSGLAVRLVAGLALAFVALHSSLLALRAGPVGSNDQTAELEQLRPIVSHAPTLFLGSDDFAGWQLHGVHLAYISTSAFPSPVHVLASSKPYSFGDPLDFDSVEGSQFNRFAYVITNNTPYASQPPVGFRLVRALPSYQLWRRTGSVSSRLSMDASQTPGAILECRSRRGARLSRRAGVAAVMEQPVVSPPIGQLSPNMHMTASLTLPRGDWDLSMQYISAETLKLTVDGSQWQLPANNIDRLGPYTYFGSVHSGGRTPVQVQIYEEHPSRFSSPADVAALSSIAATRRPEQRTLVPLSRACGRYVDWYRASD
jgi:hypothetical protein